MKIIRLQSENIKKLKAVEVVPETHLVKISGANAQGKTSVLDSIAWALGGKSLIQETPIREGEKAARIVLELGGEEAELIVKRTFTASSSALTIENADGARFKSPQSMLDEIIGQLSFDPLQFMQLKPADQLAELKRLVELPIDLDALDAQRRAAFERRTELNRDAKSLKAQAEAIHLPEDCPRAEQNASDLLGQIQDGIRQNQENQAERDALAAIKSAYAEKKRRVDDLKVELIRLEKELADLEAKGQEQREVVEQLADVDVDALRDAMSEIESRNRLAREYLKKGELRKRLAGVTADADAFTAEIKEIDERKIKALADAKFPVEGLAFGEGGVMFNGLPLQQASSAEQLRVSLAIAMASNPTLKVIRITDGSLLDSQSMALIEEMAKGHDYQVWVEVVDESGKVGIVIENGEVAAVNHAA